MDRLSRDLFDYLEFARDMAVLGKVIIDVSDGTDTCTERGRQQLEDRILAAQRERERSRDARKAAKILSDAGRWGGGQPGSATHPMRVPRPAHVPHPPRTPRLAPGAGP